MPTFTFTSPEGKTYDVEGPAGSTKEQAFQILQGQLASQSTPTQTAPTRPQPPTAARPTIADIFAHPNRAYGPSAGEQVAQGMGRLSQIPYAAGGAVTDVATRAGASPELAAGLGTAANVGLSMFPVGGAGKVASKILPPATRAVKSAATDFLGTRLPEARAAAQTAAREALTTSAGQEAARAKAMEGTRAALQTKIDATRGAPTNLDQQGSLIRNAYDSAIENARAIRSTAADEGFTKVRAAATAKEAAGARVDTAPIVGEINGMLAQAKGIPDLESGLRRILSSVQGEPGLGAPSAAQRALTSLHARTPPQQGKTFDQLELARRYLNDLGYKSDLEGYPAIIRSQARDAARKLDEAMQSFVPEFKAYKEQYAELSKPLESLSTRLGKALTGGEGGLQESAYNKVANADLPGRLFAKKDGIELLTDALAGGKDAPAAAREAAQKQVHDMVYNWIVEGQRAASGKTALNVLNAPRTVASLPPQVAARARTTFQAQAGRESAAEQLASQAAERFKSSTKMRNQIKVADELSARKSTKAQQQAFDAYSSALASAPRAVISAEKYKAAMQMLDRAQTLEERTALARKIAKGLGIGGSLLLAPEIAKHL